MNKPVQTRTTVGNRRTYSTESISKDRETERLSERKRERQRDREREIERERERNRERERVWNIRWFWKAVLIRPMPLDSRISQKIVWQTNKQTGRQTDRQTDRHIETKNKFPLNSHFNFIFRLEGESNTWFVILNSVKSSEERVFNSFTVTWEIL